MLVLTHRNEYLLPAPCAVRPVFALRFTNEPGNITAVLSWNFGSILDGASGSRITVGKVRYGLMLREDGIVLDDGTVTRFAEDRFVLSTTTAHADGVLQHLEFCHQVLYPRLDVQITAVTEQ